MMEIPSTKLIFSHSVSIEPRGKGRPRFSRNGHTYTDEKTRSYENDLSRLISLAYKKEPTQRPLEVNAMFAMVRPKSSKRPFPTVSPDLDNLAKSLLDAMNGIVFCDDKQVVIMNIAKIYDDESYIDIEVSEWLS